MFETSVVQARAKAAARRPLLFSVSIGAHAAAIVGVVTMSVAGVTLPTSAPNQVRIPFLASLPPMQGDGGQQQQKPKVVTPAPQTQKRPAMPVAPTAPQIVPDAVPQVASTTPSTSNDVGPATGSGSDTGTPGTPGVPGGSPQGVVPDGPPASGDAAEAKIYQIAGDVKAPSVLRRVTPPYPEVARRMRLNGFVILECIIDQSGQVRDAHVVRSSFAAFEQPALDAIKGWQFSPGTLNGKPVNVQFNLTISFHLN